MGWQRAAALASICLAFCLGFTAPARSEEAGLDPDLLALCKGVDPAARRYCLHAILRHGDPEEEARDTIREMAERDEVLREAAAAAYVRLYGAAPPSPPQVPPPHASARSAGDPTRVIYSPTAFTQPEGAWSFNAFELGTVAFEHGLSPNVTIGLQTALPIGAVTFGSSVRVAAPFEGGAIGFQLQGLLYVPFLANNQDPIVVAGGGPMLTLGNFDRYVNAGLLGYFVSSKNTAILIPHAGFSVRVSKSVRLGAEGYLLGAYGPTSNNEGIGKRAALVWGVHLFGEKSWGDIALVYPLCEGCFGLYSVLPLGIPFLNFGHGW
jgi:hypothetical protein